MATEVIEDYKLMRSPSGTIWKMSIDDDGEIIVQAQGTLSSSATLLAPTKAAATLGKK